MTDFGVLPAISAVGFGLAVLAAAIAFALRRAASAPPARSARRIVRILAPAFLFSSGLTLFFIILFLGRAPLERLVLGFLAITAIAMVLLAAFDLIATAAGASRTRRWLVIVLMLLVALPLVALVASSGWVAVRSFDAISLAAIAPAAALAWWSLLPPLEKPVGDVFE